MITTCAIPAGAPASGQTSAPLLELAEPELLLELEVDSVTPELPQPTATAARASAPNS